MRNGLPMSRFLRQCLWRLAMCNGLPSRVLAHKETGQRVVEYTQHELILASQLGGQVLIDTDRRYREKV